MAHLKKGWEYKHIHIHIHINIHIHIHKYIHIHTCILFSAPRDSDFPSLPGSIFLKTFICLFCILGSGGSSMSRKAISLKGIFDLIYQ